MLECTKFPKAGLGITLGVIGIPTSWFPEKLQPAGVCPEAGAIMVARVGLDPADWTINSQSPWTPLNNVFQSSNGTDVI